MRKRSMRRRMRRCRMRFEEVQDEIRRHNYAEERDML